jgi:ketosteroid isomerase-like protein
MMRLFAFLLFSVSVLQAQTGERQAIEQFFDAFHKRDTTALSKLLAPEAVFHVVAVKPDQNKLMFESRDEFLKAIASIPADLKIEERLTSRTINTTGDIANVWTDYEFYVDGKRSHQGVNSFQLYKSNEGWRIVHCVDTRKL